MKQQFRSGASLLAAMTVAAGMWAASPAMAQDATSIRSIQQQLLELQRQLKQLQSQAAQHDAQLRAAQDEAAQARAAAAQASAASQLIIPPTASPGSAIVTIPPNDVDKSTGRKFYNPSKPNGSFNLGGVTITLGGYVDTTVIGRTRNMNSGTTNTARNTPFIGPSSQGDTGEFEATAQMTRLSLRATANPGPGETLVGYIESDFNNGAGGTNANQSNSYTPRLRHAFTEYAYDPWQAYGLAGQTWTLATPFRKALDPFSTWQPPVLNSNYVVGYQYLRTPVVRIVKGVGPAWFGLEADMPQTIIGGTAPTITNGAVVSTFPGSGGLNPQNNYTLNSVPDLIAKGTVDTGFGHYEVYGIARWFRDQVTNSLTGASNSAGTNTNHSSGGGGVGASAYIPIAKLVDIEGDILYGSGVGRYGSAQLPDVTFGPNGAFKPLHNFITLIGAVGHVTPKLDLYAYYGHEGVSSSFGGAKSGYGNPNNSNLGCYNPNASVTTPATAATTCAANTSRLDEISLGYNFRLLKGRNGTLQTGLEYSHIQRAVFGAVGGSPTAIDNVFYVNLRYLPFE